MDVHCVTRWSRFDTVWEGVAVQTLIDPGPRVSRPAGGLFASDAVAAWFHDQPALA